MLNICRSVRNWTAHSFNHYLRLLNEHVPHLREDCALVAQKLESPTSKLALPGPAPDLVVSNSQLRVYELVQRVAPVSLEVSEPSVLEPSKDSPTAANDSMPLVDVS